MMHEVIFSTCQKDTTRVQVHIKKIKFDMKFNAAMKYIIDFMRLFNPTNLFLIKKSNNADPKRHTTVED